jgi:hypothetical protein
MVCATRRVRDAILISCYWERNGKGFSKIACEQGENNLKFLHKIQSLLSSAVSIVLFNLKEKCLVIKPNGLGHLQHISFVFNMYTFQISG